MAKQIYIDENGNEQLVSGTINTADMLPIESGSATNTKDYIDNLIKTATVSGTTTSSGALEIPSSIIPTRILNTVWNGTGLQKYAFCRGDNYLQVLENDGTTLKPLGNAQVTFLVVYY